MKVRGQKIQSSNRVHIFIPRGDGNHISWWAQAVQDFDFFNEVCPAPKPPSVRKKGGKVEIDLNDPTYKQASENYDVMFSSYMIIKSLDLPENEIEWETVDFKKPKTWKNYHEELRAAGFTGFEIKRIVNQCLAANCLNEGYLEEARQNFLLGTEETNESISGQNTEQASMKSGELANDSESGPLDSPVPTEA